MLTLRRPNGVSEEIGDLLVLEEGSPASHYYLTTPTATHIWLGERELERDASGWRIPIGFWVGTSMLRVGEGEAVRSIPVHVLPSSEKLDTENWLAMSEALEAWVSGVTAGLAGGRGGNVGNSGVALPLLTECLLQIVPELMRCLNAILHTPKQRATERIEEVAIHRVRAASRDTVGWLSRHSAAARYLDPTLDLEQGDPPPARIPVYRSHDDVDHPANRYVAWLVWRIGQRFAHCADGWRCHAAREDDGGLWARARASACDKSAVTLQRVMATSFLGSLARAPISEEALLVIVGDPIYARTHRLGRLLLSPLFDPAPSATHPAPVRESHTVYELWSFLEVQRQLQRALPRASWSSKGLARLLKPEATGAGAGYRAELESGVVIALDFNPTFRSHWARGSHHRWSLSSERRPDIVISAAGGGLLPRWVFLDAKYRVAREALGDGFESIHIYRDGLRDDHHGGPCVGGALLAPRQRPDTAPWFSEQYLTQHACGVFELTPSKPNDDVANWILRCLGVARPDSST